MYLDRHMLVVNLLTDDADSKSLEITCPISDDTKEVGKCRV